MLKVNDISGTTKVDISWFFGSNAKYYQTSLLHSKAGGLGADLPEPQGVLWLW